MEASRGALIRDDVSVLHQLLFVCFVSAYGAHLQSRMCELCPWLVLIGFVAAISW